MSFIPWPSIMRSGILVRCASWWKGVLTRKATDVMVSLDGSGGALEGDALDDVGVERALEEPFDLSAGVLGLGLDLCGLFFEDVDEGVADELALLFRVSDALEAVEESLRGVDDGQVDAQVLAEGLVDVFGFI